MSVFVTATGTEIGKTIACAVILARYGPSLDLGYWKPIATGAVDGRDTLEVKRLCGHVADILEESYLFAPPVSPHLAARKARRPIVPDHILEQLVAHALEDRERSLVIEGIGGVHVPITSSGYMVSHLAQDLHLPCVVVASSTLGTINHTLLTLEALRTRKIDIAGVILNGPRDRENRRAIEEYGQVEVVGEIEPIRPLTRAGVRKAARRFDRRAKLRKYFE